MPIIALPSTAKGGSLSRLVDTLIPGSGVVTTRADVHYVVTEFGVADLFDLELKQICAASQGALIAQQPNQLIPNLPQRFDPVSDLATRFPQPGVAV